MPANSRCDLIQRLMGKKCTVLVICSSLLELNFAAKDEEFHHNAMSTKRVGTIALENRISLTMSGIATCP
jgi:hypothetical protein